MIKMADIDGDGKLSYSELVATSVHRKIKLKEERIHTAFKRFDKNGDGHISVSELKTMMKEAGKKTISDEEAKSIIAEVDTDSSGTIDEKEFLAMWLVKEEAHFSGILGSTSSPKK